MKGSEILVRMLELYDVKFVFGLPGDTSVALYDALRGSSSIRHIMSRDERSAAFMADAYARLSGRPGICEGPSGGGATYIVPGVAEAFNSSIPMVVFTTDNPIDYEERGALTDLDQEALFRPITKWNTLVKRAEMLPHLVRRAFRMATAGRPGPVHLSLPEDILETETQAEDLYADPPFRSYPAVRCSAPQSDIAQAIELLRHAAHPVIVCGGGVHLSQAWIELTRLAELLTCPVGTTINGKGSISERHPLSLGVIGGNGGRDYANKVIREADVVFFIGTKANYVDTDHWRLPPRSQARIIHLDADPTELGNNYRTEVALWGDVKETLAEINRLLSESVPGSGGARDEYLASIQALAEEWWTQREARLEDRQVPLLPDHVIFELDRLLPDRAVLIADPGTPVPLLAALLHLKQEGRSFVTPRGHGGLGYAIPGVVGAQLARPHSKVVGLFGDGSLAMSAGDLETISRLGLPVTLIQFNNGTYGWIKMLQHLHYDRRYFGVDFRADVDYARIAEGFGLQVEIVNDFGDLSPALQRAVESDRAIFVDIRVRAQIEDEPPVAGWIRALRGGQ